MKDSFNHILESWYNSPLGREIFRVESKALEAVLAHAYGYHILQLGGPIQDHYLDASPILHKIRLSINLTHSYHGSIIQSRFNELSLLPNSIDVAVLPHLLEFNADDKKILNEIYHVLMPEGQVVIIGFNPISLWGLAKLFTSSRKQAPWNGKFIRAGKLRRMLTNIGFKVDGYKTYFYRPAVPYKKVLKKLLFLEGLGQLLWPYSGAIYIMLAKKSVLSVTPIKVKNHKRQRVSVTEGYAKPTTRTR